MNNPITLHAIKVGLFEPSDLSAATVLSSIFNENSEDIIFATALAISAPRRGSIFANIEMDIGSLEYSENNTDTFTDFNVVEYGYKLITALKSSQMVQCSDSNTLKPLVLEGKNLYLQRMWTYENSLALNLKRLLTSSPEIPDITALHPFTFALFSSSPNTISLQQMAAVHFVHNPFSVLTGGPGTGKTWALRNALTLKFISLLLNFRSSVAQEKETKPSFPKAILAAPTGKAAARMKESIQDGLDEHLHRLSSLLSLQEIAWLKDWLSDIPTLTIHRMLGWNPQNPSKFVYNQQNPLTVDLLLVDEASMIDLSLMSKLMEALPNNVQVALVGDPNQLSSVDAGTVLSDICLQSGNSQSPLYGHIVELTESRRFSKDKGIGKFSLNCLGNREQHISAINSLLDSSITETRLISDSTYTPSPRVRNLIRKCLTPFYQAISALSVTPSQDEVDEVLDSMGQFQILCSQRQGRFGVHAINTLVEAVLTKQFPFIQEGTLYPGLKILVTRNDTSTGLFNGDMGVMLKTPKGLQAFFPNHNRSFAIPQLPEWERANAMTIHKSQGSEFAHTMMILPSKSSDKITRELIYTGATRAKNELSIVASVETITHGLTNLVKRHSGLPQKLG